MSICRLFGITRQAYYSHWWRLADLSIEEELIIKEVQRIRQLHPVLGTRKLQVLLQPFLLEHQIKIGRDGLFDLLATHKLLVKKTKRRIYTTNSHHWLRKYPNLIRGFEPTGVNQLWVSDITYWKIGTGHAYISFITDAYSRKIVGYHVAETLAAVETVQALHMALSGLGPECCLQLTHHSDRGVQYCSHEYVKLLQDNGIQISMTENGDPLENAIAERINGIMKEEYLKHYVVSNIEAAKEILKGQVEIYNVLRPHMSCGWLTPNLVHNSNIKVNKEWKTYYQKKNL